MKFDGIEYMVRKRLYKSRGSANQTLSLKSNDRTEPNKAYYIVERDEKLFWVKERLLPDAPEFIGFGTAKDEYERLLKVQNVVCELDDITVRAIKIFGFDDNRILMEFCRYQTFEKIKKPKLKFVERLVTKWLEKVGLKETYDLCANNILAPKDLSELVLVDFEIASGENRL